MEGMQVLRAAWCQAWEGLYRELCHHRTSWEIHWMASLQSDTVTDQSQSGTCTCNSVSPTKSSTRKKCAECHTLSMGISLRVQVTMARCTLATLWTLRKSLLSRHLNMKIKLSLLSGIHTYPCYWVHQLIRLQGSGTHNTTQTELLTNDLINSNLSSNLVFLKNPKTLVLKVNSLIEIPILKVLNLTSLYSHSQLN